MSLEPFVLLSDVSGYRPCAWSFLEDDAGREHWVPFFIRHFDTILNLGTEVELSRGAAPGEVAARVEGCRADFRARFGGYLERYREYGRITILDLDKWRDETLRKYGLVDPFSLLKERENTKMVPLLGEVCGQLDRLGVEERARALVEGLFAGNIFDMGTEATAKQFLGESPDFFAVRSKLQPRPWLIDTFDALGLELVRHLRGERRWRRVVFFVDNAGSDFVLGAVPFMRAMALGGAKVTLAANEYPTLNDMTIAEIRRWWPRLVAAEPSLAGLAIEAVSTGTAEPLIDLGKVSRELNTACADMGGEDCLVVLEGMGRGVESNLDVRTRCETLNIGMIKDTHIAGRHGGKIYDCVCKYRGVGEG
jgi:type II pantothenate kinase